jgi:hypothetical protein
MTAVRKPQGRDHFENLSVDWIIILRRDVKKFFVCGYMEWMEMAQNRVW